MSIRGIQSHFSVLLAQLLGVLQRRLSLHFLKMQQMHCTLSIYHSSSCFSKWPNWPKNGYSGPQNESRQYRAFISELRQGGSVLFCCGLGGAEVAGVNRILDPHRPAPGNWLKKPPVPPPPTHMRWMESGLLRGRAGHRLFTKCVNLRRCRWRPRSEEESKMRSPDWWKSNCK